MRSIRILCIGTLFGLLMGSGASWAAPPPDTSGISAACPDSLVPLPNRAQKVRALAPGVQLRVWEVSQPATYGTLPPRVIISVVRVSAGRAYVAPLSAGVPLLIHPRQAFESDAVVATVNGDYFEALRQGDALPTGAVVIDGRPLYAPVGGSRVIAIDEHGIPRNTFVSAEVTVRVGDQNVRPRGINDPTAPSERAVLFTDDWSRSNVPSGRYAIVIKDGRVTNVVAPDKVARVPTGGYVVWTDLPGAVEKLAPGARVTVSVGVEARDGLAVSSASGHGGAYLVDGRITQPCSAYENALRPRTLLAWNPRGDMWLITASTGLPDPPGGLRVGGSTKHQMAQVARWLGATEAVTMDGGGSTSLYAREARGVRRIDLPQDVWTRPVPVLWGVSRG